MPFQLKSNYSLSDALIHLVYIKSMKNKSTGIYYYKDVSDGSVWSLRSRVIPPTVPNSMSEYDFKFLVDLLGYTWNPIFHPYIKYIRHLVSGIDTSVFKDIMYRSMNVNVNLRAAGVYKDVLLKLGMWTFMDSVKARLNIE